jgi:hypothetical protein
VLFMHRLPTERPSVPYTPALENFSHSFLHAKAPAHAEGQNLIRERASSCFRFAPYFWRHRHVPYSHGELRYDT